jgi:hypothetical protein
MIDGEVSLGGSMTFDPAKRYRYTWPGQKPQIATGLALTAICKGADPAMLAIEEIEPPRDRAASER